MEKTIEYNGKSLYYRSIGEGPCVVLLHGFGEEGSVWRAQWEALTGFRVIVPDLPGSGWSELQEDMSMESLAETVSFILDEEGISACTLIGQSMGGYVTLAFAEHQASRLQGFGLFHSTAAADSAEKITTRKKGIRFIQEKGAFEFLKTAIPNFFSDYTKENNPELVEEWVQAARSFSKEALIAYYEAMIERPDRTQVLKQNKYPVLFVFGKYDSIIPLENGLKQAHLPDLSYIQILDKSGHMGMCEQPVESNHLLLDYLSGLVKEYSIQ